MRISRNDVTIRPVASMEEAESDSTVGFGALLLGRSCR